MIDVRFHEPIGIVLPVLVPLRPIPMIIECFDPEGCIQRGLDAI